MWAAGIDRRCKTDRTRSLDLHCSSHQPDNPSNSSRHSLRHSPTHFARHLHRKRALSHTYRIDSDRSDNRNFAHSFSHSGTARSRRRSPYRSPNRFEPRPYSWACCTSPPGNTSSCSPNLPNTIRPHKRGTDHRNLCQFHWNLAFHFHMSLGDTSRLLHRRPSHIVHPRRRRHRPRTCPPLFCCCTVALRYTTGSCR